MDVKPVKGKQHFFQILFPPHVIVFLPKLLMLDIYERECRNDCTFSCHSRCSSILTLSQNPEDTKWHLPKPDVLDAKPAGRPRRRGIFRQIRSQMHNSSGSQVLLTHTHPSSEASEKCIQLRVASLTQLPLTYAHSDTLSGSAHLSCWHSCGYERENAAPSNRRALLFSLPNCLRNTFFHLMSEEKPLSSWELD